MDSIFEVKLLTQYQNLYSITHLTSEFKQDTQSKPNYSEIDYLTPNQNLEEDFNF